MVRPMTGRLRHALVALAALTSAACDGYAELPLPTREAGDLVIEQVALFPGAIGRIQVRLAPPADALGPFFVVGPPVSGTPSVQIVNFAFGPCDPDAPPPDDPQRVLCLAARAGAGTRSEPLVLGVVVDSRADARRFTLVGEVEAP